MKLQLPKGTRDLKPEEAIIKNKIIDTLRGVFEEYGYSPMFTPLIERYDILASKYAGGSEILKETFKFKDQGKRDMGLRYDMTVSLARFIGQNPNVKLPFKRYIIGDVFRDGPVQKSRYRQFTQCDIDIIGSKSMRSDAEIILLCSYAFSKLDIDINIHVNNRDIMNELLIYSGVKKEELEKVILSIDKLEKFGKDYVIKELKGKKIDDKVIKNILKNININGSNTEKIKKIKKMIKDPSCLGQITELISILGVLKVNFVFDTSLARGLSYYTGNIIEIFLKHGNIKNSLCAGGRYDKMIGSFIDKGDYPAVGISFGVDRIFDAFVEKNIQMKKTTTEVFIIPINTFNDSLKIAQELRNEGINVEIDIMDKGPSKNLKYANAKGIPFVIFIGQEELKKGKVKLKDMDSGHEKFMTAEELVFFFQENKNKIIK